MADAIERVLRLVAEGRLTAEEAAPLLDALQATGAGVRSTGATGAGPGSGTVPGPMTGSATAGAAGEGPRFARIEVRDGGKRVVDLRIPISLGRLALGRVPGLTSSHLADVEAAVAAGTHGPILDVEDADGDGVRIVLE